ncbi:MAG: hypothetical protein DLM72_17445 [Candidatus Nitrosopolaris wilkensis]|nr:MAG: hypothetical protein DLM72_17445 [Candidatus Nitrosopolaris wilkensis]
MIDNLSVENQVVLDPMLGSGSTGVASIRSNRRFIGYENDQHYYTTAADRIRTCRLQVIPRI